MVVVLYEELFASPMFIEHEGPSSCWPEGKQCTKVARGYESSYSRRARNLEPGTTFLNFEGESAYSGSALTPLGSAIRESLRLSAASMNIRVAQDDFVLQLVHGYSVPVRRGDVIALYPQSMHMDPEIFEDPQVRGHVS